MVLISWCLFSESAYNLAFLIQKKRNKQKEVDSNGNLFLILLNLGSHITFGFYISSPLLKIQVQ